MKHPSIKHLKLIIGLGLLTGLTTSATLATGGTAGPALSPLASEIIDHLVADWKHRFHSTTIPHAMANLGLAVDDDIRLEVVEYLRKNPGLSRSVRSWGPNNYLLTNTERRIAKLLLNSRRDSGKLPSAAEVRKKIGLSRRALNDRLAFMARAGFLEADRSQSLGYTLAADAEIWGGPLRHNYHTIIPGGEDKFDVW